MPSKIGANVRVTSGDELDAGLSDDRRGRRVQRSSERAPRLIELNWGNPKHPRVAIIGKGVCFDSGGLDIKPASGMRLMKKDMGGAAHALALGRLIMGERLPVRLHLLIPAVENAFRAMPYRPGDIVKPQGPDTSKSTIPTRKAGWSSATPSPGPAEDEPELIIDFATLTGAARVALGPDLPALFANDDALAADLDAAGKDVDRSGVADAALGCAMTKC